MCQWAQCGHGRLNLSKRSAYTGCGAEQRRVTDPVGGGGRTRSGSVKLSHRSPDTQSCYRAEWEEMGFFTSLSNKQNKLTISRGTKGKLTCPVPPGASCLGRAGSGNTPETGWSRPSGGQRSCPCLALTQSEWAVAPAGCRNTPTPGWRSNRSWRWRVERGSERGSEPAYFRHSASAPTWRC